MLRLSTDRAIQNVNVIIAMTTVIPVIDKRRTIRREMFVPVFEFRFKPMFLSNYGLSDTHNLLRND